MKERKHVRQDLIGWREIRRGGGLIITPRFQSLFGAFVIAVLLLV